MTASVCLTLACVSGAGAGERQRSVGEAGRTVGPTEDGEHTSARPQRRANRTGGELERSCHLQEVRRHTSLPLLHVYLTFFIRDNSYQNYY